MNVEYLLKICGKAFIVQFSSHFCYLHFFEYSSRYIFSQFRFISFPCVGTSHIASK